MPNDDLGSFPTPPVASPTLTPSVDPAPIDTPISVSPSTTESIIPSNFADSAPATPPIIPDSVFSSVSQTAPFEETPETIPSIQEPVPAEITLPQVQPNPQPIETPATLPPKSGGSFAPVIIVVLLIVAGIGLAAAAFLYQQTGNLKNQLSEITQTLQKQETTLTPTPSPTVFVIPTPTISTTGGTVTPTATPTVTFTNTQTPLKNAPAALQIAINHSPNAQLILIKVDNATDPVTAVTKYFFREDLSTKKYFYVAISGTSSPEIIDKQIYVTPDDNIPSLNDSVLSDKLGLDLDEAVRTTYTQCANQTVCTNAPIKAQYIKTGTGIIWQLSIYTNGLTGTPLMIQINAETKAILYKSPEFANK